MEVSTATIPTSASEVELGCAGASTRHSMKRDRRSLLTACAGELSLPEAACASPTSSKLPAWKMAADKMECISVTSRKIQQSNHVMTDVSTFAKAQSQPNAWATHRHEACLAAS